MKRTWVMTVAITIAVCIVIYMVQSKTERGTKDGSSVHIENPMSVEEVPSKPLLTMFTTFKEIGIIPHHQLSFNIVVSNWPSFKPLVQPVMFLRYPESSMAQTALATGWDVLPMTRVNEAGTPFLRDMYQTVFDRYDSWLYGYANGDLIFDEGFANTLKVVVDQLPALKNNVLLTGIRTNVDVDMSRPVSLEEFQKDRLQNVTKQRGQLFQEGAVDYFFITKDGCSLNWSSLLDLVIGRPAYGTYLVAMAADQGVGVIDTTGTVLAVHLSEKGVVSHGSQNPDGEFNRKLIGSKFNHFKGFSKNAKLATIFNADGKVELFRRS